ncbi:MAG: hypothetical protein U0Q12_08685 [Vicinamibacterales bacterium]
MRMTAKWAAIAALCLVPSIGSSAKQASQANGGNGTLYIGAYPNRVLIIDEATEKVTGEIKMQSTYAPGTLILSGDKKRFYTRSIDLENIEVVDIPSRKSIDLFKLSDGRRKVRIRAMAADPLDRFLVGLVKLAEKKSDHFEIGTTTLAVIDLKEHKITRTVPWPDDDARENATMMFSPDGKYLYLFGPDIVIYDTSTFQAVDKWELSQPIESGMGRIEFGATDTTFEEPGFYTAIFRVNDPLQKRLMMGIARVNLSAKTMEFSTLGPAENVTFSLAPGRKRAYGLYQSIGKYELWTFDVENRSLLKRLEFQGRPRMALKTSTNGKLLYIYQAGNTIDLYEADTYKYLRTITLDGDSTTPLQVMPAQ